MSLHFVEHHVYIRQTRHGYSLRWLANWLCVSRILTVIYLVSLPIVLVSFCENVLVLGDELLQPLNFSVRELRPGRCDYVL
jgi:hypothetical protein